MHIPLISLASYRQARELTVRQLPYGGGVLPDAEESPLGLLSRAREVVLLIHGFNVDICSAGCGYDRFARAAGIKWQSRSISVYWPGDAVSRFLRSGSKPGLYSAAVSAASYPLQVSRAQETANRLFELIINSRAGAKRPLRVSIVAHSLGCRVTLELLNLLRGSARHGPISVPLTILMAAAVPRYLVMMRGRDLRPALEVPEKVLNYYSKKDRVLQFAFRGGQLLERPFPAGFNIATRSAIGRSGLGLARPTNVEEEPKTHGHGGYWSDKDIAAAAAKGLGFDRIKRSVPRFVPDGRRELARPPVRGRKVRLRPLRSYFHAGCGECPN